MKDLSGASIPLSDTDKKLIEQVCKLTGESQEEAAEGLLRGKLLEICRTNKDTASVTDISKGLKRD
tara:strand:- start:106 stop:303 length:198 start_codon:yes stop_codon:yes gene_type:complete